MATTEAPTPAAAVTTPTRALPVAGAEALIELTDRLLASWTAVNDELVSFAKAQTEAQRQLFQGLAKCSSLSEAVGLQLDCAQDTVNRCLGIATKAGNLTTALAAHNMATLKKTRTATPAR